MPMLDMSAALCNPFTIDQFNVIRRAETIGDNGRSVLTPEPIQGVYGVVSPEKVKEIHRRDDGSLPDAVIGIVTKFALLNNSQGLQADVVLWHGNQWLVEEIMDYSSWGEGFIKATCFLQDILLQRPATKNAVPAGNQ
jgi:hypothetical protein